MGGCEKKRASGEEVGSLFRGIHINDHINVSDINHQTSISVLLSQLVSPLNASDILQ